MFQCAALYRSQGLNIRPRGDPSGAAHHEQSRWQLRFKSPGSGWAVGHAGQQGRLAEAEDQGRLTALQQLDLSNTTITQAERPEPGAATLATLFHASRLKQLSLLINNRAGEGNNLLPNLQPLSQHLTQLCLKLQEGVVRCFDKFLAALQPLAQLQVLTISPTLDLGGLPRLLQALPQLHTLHLPCATVRGQEELDALLAATQLTSIQLGSLKDLSSSRADAPCSWQRLELTHWIKYAIAAYLPLHSLTQPLVLCGLSVGMGDDGHADPSLLLAVHNLTQACNVPVRIGDLRLRMCYSRATRQHEELQQLVAVVQALNHCSWDKLTVLFMDVGAADVVTLAPLCQGCTHIQFYDCGVAPSLEFWRQLVQLMPTITNVVFEYAEGSTSSAMHQSLQLMADQPWARWLDICIGKPAASCHAWSSRACTRLKSHSSSARACAPCKYVLATAVDGWAALGQVAGRQGSSEPAATCSQLGAGETLSLTCPDFSKTNLMYAPALHIQLDSQRCEQMLTPRVVAALRARTCKLALTLLSLQLQQLDLSSTKIIQPKQPEPGAATLANLFHASKLKQLRLLIQLEAGDDKPRLPNLQPLSQQLTQLCLEQERYMLLGNFIAALQPLAQLQVLTISCVQHLWGLPRLLQALPRLHTLHLPGATGRGQEDLETLLAATQLTSIKLRSLKDLGSSRADAPCSWQRLELTGWIDYATAAYLPLHSLTQPLVLCGLSVGMGDDGDADPSLLMAAAVHNLTQACNVPVKIGDLQIVMSYSRATRQHEELQQLVVVVQALNHCSWAKVTVLFMDVGAADVVTLAPLCQGCTHIEFSDCRVTPSLEFWRQLVQLMPTITNVVFEYAEGSTSSAMHQSLQLMADQPWARWLDICIEKPSASYKLPTCWQASPLTQPGKLRVWFM
ncbi:hypothetical protein V8C86DRAFT_3035469 [Haematococcus lacustris]